MDGIPLLVLACGIRRDTDKAYQLHDIDQLAVARPVTKAQLTPASGAEIYATLCRACRLARKAPQGPVIVEIPVDHYMFRHRAQLETPEEDWTSPVAPSPEIMMKARALIKEKTPVLVEVAIDYSAKTYFTKGVVRITLNRLPWADRLRFLARAIGRRLPIPGLR